MPENFPASVRVTTHIYIALTVGTATTHVRITRRVAHAFASLSLLCHCTVYWYRFSFPVSFPAPQCPNRNTLGLLWRRFQVRFQGSSRTLKATSLDHPLNFDLALIPCFSFSRFRFSDCIFSPHPLYITYSTPDPTLLYLSSLTLPHPSLVFHALPCLSRPILPIPVFSSVALLSLNVF